MIFETIRIVNGEAQFLEFHEERLNRSRRALGFGDDPVSLRSVIAVPEEFSRGVARCRIDVGHKIEGITFSFYEVRHLRRVAVVGAEVEYPHKFSDRRVFQDLSACYPEYDDLLIFQNGLLTDSTIANIALERDGRWYTPAQPILCGTTRARLLKDRTLLPASISLADLQQFSRLMLINAMRAFDETLAVPISAIDCFPIPVRQLS